MKRRDKADMTQSDQQTPSLPPCPLCQADGTYREWRRVTVEGHSLKMDSYAHPFLGAIVEAFVCTECGNVQFFADPEEL